MTTGLTLQSGIRRLHRYRLACEMVRTPVVMAVDMVLSFPHSGARDLGIDRAMIQVAICGMLTDPAG